MGAGVPRAGVGPGCAARIDASRADAPRDPPRHRENRERPHGHRGAVHRAKARGDRRAGLVRFRAEEGLADLWPGAGPRVQRQRRADAGRARALCRGAGRALSHAAGRRRGAVSRPAAPRKFHRMHLRVSRSVAPLHRPMDDGRSRAFSHRAKADAAGARARRRISASGGWWRAASRCRAPNCRRGTQRSS